MKRYYSIDFQAMKTARLNATQWMILEDIHFRQARSESGWCEDTRGSMAEDHQLSLRGFTTNIKFLIENGFLTRNKLNHIRTTNKWHAVQECANHKKNESEEGRQKSASRQKIARQKSAGQVGKKVPTTSYKKAFRENKKNILKKSRAESEKIADTGCADAPKKISFNLTTKQPYSKLSEDYKQMLYGYAITKDGAEQFQAFIDTHSAKGSAFKDWAAAYRTWLRNVPNFGGTLSQPREVTGQRGEALYLDYTGSAAVIKGDESYTPRPVKKRPSEPMRSGQEETAPRLDVMQAVGDLAEKFRNGGERCGF